MPLQSVYLNGGFIGVTTSYQLAVPAGLETLTYVDGLTTSGAGTTGAITVSLTGITMQENDLVIVALAMSGNATRSFRIDDGSTLYTEVANIAAVDSEIAALQVGYKFMGATPDTSFRIPGGTGSTNDAYAIAVHVWRNVDQTTPMDVTAVTRTQINTQLVDPNPITPVTSGAQILIAGSGAHTGGVDTYTASYLSNFFSSGGNATNDTTVGLGNIAWTGGSYDGAAWTHTQGISTAFSCASVVMALRPATTAPIASNDGIFNLQAVTEALSV